MHRKLDQALAYLYSFRWIIFWSKWNKFAWNLYIFCFIQKFPVLRYYRVDKFLMLRINPFIIWLLNLFFHNPNLFLVEFGSKNYYKHISDHLAVGSPILVHRISQERYKLQTWNIFCRSALERTDHKKLFMLIRLFVRLNVLLISQSAQSNFLLTLYIQRRMTWRLEYFWAEMFGSVSSCYSSVLQFQNKFSESRYL